MILLPLLWLSYTKEQNYNFKSKQGRVKLKNFTQEISKKKQIIKIILNKLDSDGASF